MLTAERMLPVLRRRKLYGGFVSIMGQFYIGVDGGGTKTLGAIAKEDGVILAQLEVGSTNHQSNPMEFVRGNLDHLITHLLTEVKAEPDDVACICLGMAGVDRPEDKKLVKALIAEFLPNSECISVNDGVIALVGGANRPVGIIVIAGTGSIAFGFNEAGDHSRGGGWGNVLGDEGSGYALGLRAMRAVMRAHDGRTPPTRLREVVLQHFSLDRPEQLLGWVKEHLTNKSDIAALSRLLFVAVEQGDEIATKIMHEEAEELALAAFAVAGRLFPNRSDFEVVVGGGNLRKSQVYFDAFKKALSLRLPGVGVIRPQREPVEGAVIHAIQQTVKA